MGPQVGISRAHASERLEPALSGDEACASALHAAKAAAAVVGAMAMYSEQLEQVEWPSSPSPPPPPPTAKTAAATATAARAGGGCHGRTHAARHARPARLHGGRPRSGSRAQHALAPSWWLAAVPLRTGTVESAASAVLHLASLPWWCYSSLAWPAGSGAPGSWLRCALRASRSAAQRPVGGCGEARPKLRTPRRSTPRRTDALVVPVDGRGGRRRGAPCRRCCRGPRTRATHRGGRCLRRLLPLILTLTLASPSPDPSSNPNQVSDDCGDPYGVPELPAKLQAPSTPAAPYRPLPPLTAPRHARRPSPPHAIPSPPRAAHAARAAFDR